MEIIDCPNYLIYRDGRVWSKARKGTKGGFLKSWINSEGYCEIELTEKSKRIRFKVHRLIALHYIPNPNNYPEIDHINRIKTDNRIENLRWVTPHMNSNNKGEYKNNTSGHKYIYYRKEKNTWRFNIKHKKINFNSKNKIYCLCYKYIYLLKIKTFNK